MKRLLATMVFAGLIATPCALAQDKKPDKPAPTPSNRPALPVPPGGADDKGGKPATGPSTGATAPVTKTPEEMEKAGKPGEKHKWLEQLEGEWEAQVKDFSSGKEVLSKGEMSSKMVFGGRFLQSEFKGRMDNKFFYGTSVIGYDNNTKRFESVWYDSMSTGIEKSTGKEDTAGKVLAMVGEAYMPWGRTRTREVTTIISKDQHTLEYFADKDGKPMKVMEIAYTRKGKGEGKPEEKSEKKEEKKKGS